MQLVADSMYLVDGDAHIPCLAPDNTWAFERSPHNDRGDDSSVLDRMASLEELGMVQGVSGGPWLVEKANEKGHFWVLHWATRLEALQRLWSQGKHVNDKLLALTKEGGIKHCK
eukprot:10417306-Alexandrium_andersonii.AAC.1